MRRKRIFVSSNGGKKRLLHRFNFFTVHHGFHIEFIDNRVTFIESSEFTEWSSDSRQENAENCDATVSPNPFALFAFSSEWATLEAYNFKNIGNF